MFKERERERESGPPHLNSLSLGPTAGRKAGHSITPTNPPQHTLAGVETGAVSSRLPPTGDM